MGGWERSGVRCLYWLGGKIKLCRLLMRLCFGGEDGDYVFCGGEEAVADCAGRRACADVVEEDGAGERSQWFIVLRRC